jgi:hypothetical protein
MIGRDAYSNLHVCQTCGFQGPLFPEVPAEVAAKLPDKPINFNPSSMPIFATPPPNKDELKRMRTRFAIVMGGLIFVIIIFLLLSR